MLIKERKILLLKFLRRVWN